MHAAVGAVDHARPHSALPYKHMHQHVATPEAHLSVECLDVVVEGLHLLPMRQPLLVQALLSILVGLTNTREAGFTTIHE